MKQIIKISVQKGEKNVLEMLESLKKLFKMFKIYVKNSLDENGDYSNYDYYVDYDLQCNIANIKCSINTIVINNQERNIIFKSQIGEEEYEKIVYKIYFSENNSIYKVFLLEGEKCKEIDKFVRENKDKLFFVEVSIQEEGTIEYEWSELHYDTPRTERRY